MDGMCWNIWYYPPNPSQKVWKGAACVEQVRRRAVCSPLVWCSESPPQPRRWGRWIPLSRAPWCGMSLLWAVLQRFLPSAGLGWGVGDMVEAGVELWRATE